MAMADDQATRLKTVAQQQESFFFPGVIRVINQAGALVQKNGSVLPQMRRHA
jgi:hypothetical protein